MKECQFCKEDIKEGAKVCPYCKRTQIEGAFKAYLWFLVIGVIAFLIWSFFFMSSLIP